jgi:arylsulfatase A-like enzyme
MNLNPMPGVACGINLQYDFIAQVLRRAGYKTAALGKVSLPCSLSGMSGSVPCRIHQIERPPFATRLQWHLGFQSNEYTPTFRGFDTYTGYYSGAEEHFTHYKAGEGKNYFDLANNSGVHVSPLFSMVGKTQNETEEFYSVYIYGNETVRLIRRHAELYASSPLYVYLAWNVVHAPDEAPEWAVAANPEEQNPERRLFAGMLSALDVGVRHIVDEMKAHSMWENAIFVFRYRYLANVLANKFVCAERLSVLNVAAAAVQHRQWRQPRRRGQQPAYAGGQVYLLGGWDTWHRLHPLSNSRTQPTAGVERPDACKLHA